MVVPLVFMDISVILYQHICFRIYGIHRVKRGDYFTIDRHYLFYLNLIEKANCLYCGYGNCLIEYAREVIARTECWLPLYLTKYRLKTPEYPTGDLLETVH
jgi:hypothetical protein